MELRGTKRAANLIQCANAGRCPRGTTLFCESTENKRKKLAELALRSWTRLKRLSPKGINVIRN